MRESNKRGESNVESEGSKIQLGNSKRRQPEVNNQRVVKSINRKSPTIKRTKMYDARARTWMSFVRPGSARYLLARCWELGSKRRINARRSHDDTHA